ncbi:4Fe-4S dicluster domain-containing protein [Geomonas sp. Red32]|uniref:heterodisulfide reductase-related iron-sulfur binding cluster n=1 Tax=Geomonas sp. Red32 TaxID=2912856 RepID=UPI00202CE919|nr:heterodisulfide reductase-related iron-sulfur binding cluster [Geomonas sp. Red32]MCM0084160.1 4Fe-4S dicluster domain-containing protein [Geomonas sp. Red32]
MEATREIYWNVGHGATGPMYCLAAVSLALCGWGIWRRVPVYRLGRPLNRLDRLPERIGFWLKASFAQTRVLLVRRPGTLHALFFWGFLLLFIGTLLVMLQADFTDPLFLVRFLKGPFYLVFKVVLNTAGIAAIASLLGFAIRRYLFTPMNLQTGKDDYLSHLLLFSILITGFWLEGARMAATELRSNPAIAPFSYGGLAVARLLDGWDVPRLRFLHRALWWFHLGVSMAFIALIPVTKLRHLFLTGVNYLFTDVRPKGAIETIDLEDESRESCGVTRVEDFSWKDIYDADACTACKRCQDRCPAWVTAKPLSPMIVIQQVGEVAFARPRDDLVEVVSREVLWDCTTCRACQEICPANIEHVNKILEMRRNLSLMRGEFPGDEVRGALANYEVNGNPFGMAYARRGDWAEGIDVAVLGEGERADVLYFGGCYASFDRRNQAVARAFARICSAAGIRLAILGKEETCCGEPPRKLGNECLYQQMARANIEKMQAHGVTKVVATCPHCYNTLVRDYRDLGFTAEVEHHTTFLLRLLDEGRLDLQPEEFACTYHDSCYLARYRDIATEPRAVLARSGARITEMAQSGRETFCCGGGGGRVLAEERVGARIGETRISMAAATGEPVLVANCPFCLTLFEDGIKTGGFEGRVRARDLAEVVAERLPAVS